MKQLRIAVLMLGVLSLLLGIVYPLVMTGVFQVLFPRRANGSLITLHDRIIGSELIGQSFTSPGYFHGRPSDCGYDAANSAASNLGPSNPKLFEQVQGRIDTARGEDGLADTTPVPADLVLSSASGLDPEITPSSALLQIVRIAAVRHLEVAVVRHLVEQHTQRPVLRIFGQERVNVLKLNLALDSIAQ
jgi:K+-transporting ATPase ATPase C chain